MARPLDHLFLPHARNYLFGICIGILAPANIGADLYRFGSLSKTGNKWAIISLLVQEKILILLGYFVSIVLLLVVVAVAGLRLAREQEFALAAVGASSLVGATLILCLRPLVSAAERTRWVSGRWAQLLAALRSVVSLGTMQRRLLLIGLSVSSVAAWLCAVSAVAAGFQRTLPLPLLWLVAILADVVRYMPLSLQGIGVREAAFASMFLFCGASSAQGFVIGGTAYLILTAAMVLAGVRALGVDLIEAVEGTFRGSSRAIAGRQSARD